MSYDLRSIDVKRQKVSFYDLHKALLLLYLGEKGIIIIDIADWLILIRNTRF
jgi:hypothetical protein